MLLFIDIWRRHLPEVQCEHQETLFMIINFLLLKNFKRFQKLKKAHWSQFWPVGLVKWVILNFTTPQALHRKTKLYSHEVSCFQNEGLRNKKFGELNFNLVWLLVLQSLALHKWFTTAPIYSAHTRIKKC